MSKPFSFPSGLSKKMHLAIGIDGKSDAPIKAGRKEIEVAPIEGEALSVEQVTVYDSGIGEGGSEVVSHFDGRLYVTNGEADRIDVIDVETGELLNSIDLTDIPGYDGLNSVTASSSGIAVAVEIKNAQAPASPVPVDENGDDATPIFTVDTSLANGVVAIYDLDGTPKGTVEVGNLPDMVTYSQDGTMIFVANEGEPQSGQDPAGSISIIDVRTMTAQTFGFDEFNDQVETLREAGVRIFPGKTPGTDFEPEYIAQSGNLLFVTLQEANAVAIFDLNIMAWDKIVPLGTQDYSNVPLDPLDDGLINRDTYAGLVGMRMPDALAATEIDGVSYFLTANEGDDRGDFDEGGDAARVGDILDGDVEGVSFDESVVTDGLERLNISIFDGDTDGDGDIDIMHAYGSRSFTIFDADGNLVFDSGDDFERILSEIAPERFNNDDGETLGELDDDGDLIVDNRSDAKGPEPEAIEVGKIGDATYAFIGLERDSGIMIYDISDPTNSEFVDYIDGHALGNVSPEIIDFIAPQDSASGYAQLAVSYEVSGTTAVYELAFGSEFSGTNAADEINGTIGDDVVNAGRGADVVDGGAGDDIIHGGRGADILVGGMGDDMIHGGRGGDLINGGTGNDTMSGGRGSDVFEFQLGDGEDTITDFARNDMIDMTATGLSFEDLTITESNSMFTVAYGDQGDSIEIALVGSLSDLGADNFVF